ncbi:MAG: hypothetical protein ACYST0_09420 [Planctomycetota bacterium]|jgi:hypothetical protein
MTRIPAPPALVLASLLLAAMAAGQTDQTPEEQLQAKLASPFLKKASWHTNYDKACAAAAGSGKLIFGYFTTAGY